jgi:hypothetical protein
MNVSGGQCACRLQQKQTITRWVNKKIAGGQFSANKNYRSLL